MQLVEDLFFLLGAIALFLYGLKILSEGVSKVCGDRIKRVIKGATSSKIGAILSGFLTTVVAQSSIATNTVVITFVEKGIISLYSALAVIMGTNVGTTVTAQLVSLSSISNFSVSAIGSIMAFIGLLLNFCKKDGLKNLGLSIMGFGFIFMGIELLTGVVERFKRYLWFTALFKVKNPLLLVANGFIITAILQSSSVVSSVMIVLASLNLLDFKSATFLILGANVGTCLPVIYSSLGMGKDSIKCAIFNLLFNVVGVILFFFPLIFWGDKLLGLAIFSSSIARNVANFHTLFNVAVTVILLPLIKPLCKAVEKIYNFLFLKKQSLGKAKKHNKKKRAGKKSLAGA